MDSDDRLLWWLLVCVTVVIVTAIICVTAYNWHLSGLPCHAAGKC